MPYNLIPFPISIFFVFVFGVAWLAVLWKLRKRGKFYSILFKISLVSILFLFAIMLYSIMDSFLARPVPIPAITPRPAG